MRQGPQLRKVHERRRPWGFCLGVCVWGLWLMMIGWLMLMGWLIWLVDWVCVSFFLRWWWWLVVV